MKIKKQVRLGENSNELIKFFKEIDKDFGLK